MTSYSVEVPTRSTQLYLVQAKNKAEAMRKVDTLERDIDDYDVLWVDSDMNFIGKAKSAVEIIEDS